MTTPRYVLGHSDFELQRLARQAQFLEPTTREYFRIAGMAAGAAGAAGGPIGTGRRITSSEPDNPGSLLCFVFRRRAIAIDHMTLLK